MDTAPAAAAPTLADAGGLAADAVRAGVTAVRDVHHAISGRVFRSLRRGLGPVPAPVRAAHDGLSSAIYTTVAGAGSASLRLASRAAGRRPLPDTARAIGVLGALGGAFGDRIEQRYPALVPRCTVVVSGHPVACTRDALAAAFPDARGTVVVFAHGLCETETAWAWNAQQWWGDPRSTPASRLARDCGVTGVLLRYNSGAHISESGRRVAALLAELVAAWPVPVRRIVLVGHSMGGLVFRSALHQTLCGADAGGPDGAPWPGLVSDLVTLGAPHLGSKVETTALAAAAVLGRIGETRPLAAALRARSVGVKDLGHGHLLDDDWQGRDPDARGSCTGCSAVPFPPGVRHHAVGATLGATPQALASRAFGDVLVHLPSAHGGPGRVQLPFEAEDLTHIGRAHHFTLLNSPEAYAVLRRVLERPDTMPVAASGG